MKVDCRVKINSKKTINELPEAWSKQDFLNILDLMGFSDEISDAEVKEMTMMALADQEPEESAALLLQYRLEEQLTAGQIKQLSHEMQEDKASEEYPDIFLQQELFNINQLLFKAFNGRFPNCHAIDLNINIAVRPANFMMDENYLNEIILKALVPALGEHSGISRLYEEEIEGLKKFIDAEGIIWKSDIQKLEDGTFNIRIFSSEYWLHDLPQRHAYEAKIKLFEPVEAHD